MTSTLKSGNKQDDGADSSSLRELQLLPARPEPFGVFAGNLFDRIQGRVVPVVETTSAPDYRFWYGVDLQGPLPGRGLGGSVLVHAVLLGMLCAVSLWPESVAHLDNSLSSRKLSSYELSQYLPELHGAQTHRKAKGKADPVLAKQEIESLPDAPDNLHQTIVAPPKLKLQHDVELPNLVAYKVAPPALVLDGLVAGPPPTLAAPAEIVQNKPSRAVPKVQPRAAQAAPAVDLVGRPSPPNLAQLLPAGADAMPAAPPKPVAEIVQSKPRRALSNSQPAEVQAAPGVGSIGQPNAPNLAQMLPPGAKPVGPASDPQIPQVVALNAHPAEISAPVATPQGNRSGAFAASPAGHANATGAPGEGASSGVGAHESGAKLNAPAGITVGASPLPSAPVASVNAPSPKAGAADPGARAKLMAAMHPPVTASIPPHQPVAHEAPGPRSELENHVFAGRRSYTLAVNMPNLNSSTGSWIIHFVDKDQGLTPGAISAPEVVSKFDPAYPGELIRDGVQGTVFLTAIIHADGSVSDVAVAQSVDPMLDQNAMQAFSRWVFRPALKDGQAIDLVAVIAVPFRAKSNGF